VPESPLTVRPLTEEDIDSFYAVLDAAFLRDRAPEDVDWYRAEREPVRAHGVFDGDELIGGGGVLTRRMTLPLAGPQDVAAVTAVGVSPGHRRRGVLTAVMRAQLHGLHESGAEPVAALWASEGGIYGRFGYSVAAQCVNLSLSRAPRFRCDIDTGDRVRELPREQALPLLREFYDKAAPHRVGWLSRLEGSWQHVLADFEHRRRGFSAFRFAVHPEGYAVYRVKSAWDERGPAFELAVHELVAMSPVAHAALWRYLLDVDLVATVGYRLSALDDPIVHLLANPRAAVRTVSDSLWVRLVELDRALLARRYAAPLDTVVEVTDELCPWNAGRWAMVVDGSGRAQVRRTDAEPLLALDVADLGAAFLGGTTLTALAAAQRVRELSPGALQAAALAFHGEHEPHCPEIF
jgi:predicted acetyltransferase